MMNLAMNFDTDECLVTAMFDKELYRHPEVMVSPDVSQTL